MSEPLTTGDIDVRWLNYFMSRQILAANAATGELVAKVCGPTGSWRPVLVPRQVIELISGSHQQRADAEMVAPPAVVGGTLDLGEGLFDREPVLTFSKLAAFHIDPDEGPVAIETPEAMEAFGDSYSAMKDFFTEQYGAKFLPYTQANLDRMTIGFTDGLKSMSIDKSSDLIRDLFEIAHIKVDNLNKMIIGVVPKGFKKEIERKYNNPLELFIAKTSKFPNYQVHIEEMDDEPWGIRYKEYPLCGPNLLSPNTTKLQANLAYMSNFRKGFYRSAEGNHIYEYGANTDQITKTRMLGEPARNLHLAYLNAWHSTEGRRMYPKPGIVAVDPPFL